MLRRLLLLGVLLLLVLAGGGVAIARSSPALRASGPTSVTGTEASAVFTIADRTVRQVRYADGGTLRYTSRAGSSTHPARSRRRSATSRWRAGPRWAA